MEGDGGYSSDEFGSVASSEADKKDNKDSKDREDLTESDGEESRSRAGSNEAPRRSRQRSDGEESSRRAESDEESRRSRADSRENSDGGDSDRSRRGRRTRSTPSSRDSRDVSSERSSKSPPAENRERRENVEEDNPDDVAKEERATSGHAVRQVGVVASDQPKLEGSLSGADKLAALEEEFKKLSSSARTASLVLKEPKKSPEPLDLDLLHQSVASQPGPKTPGTAGTQGASSASGAETVTPSLCNGEITEFQVYQKFRLQMVKLFGSLCSALYEIGLDPETGRLDRSEFEKILISKFGFKPAEANVLFSTAINADIMDGGLGGQAHYSDFGIKDEEWKLLVQQKHQVEQSGHGSMPFSSGPGGRAIGVFHRPVTLDNVHTKETKGEQAGDGTPVSQSTPRLGRSAGSDKEGGGLQSRRRVSATPKAKAWKQPQKPWAPSLLAGGGTPRRLEDVVARGRTNETSVFQTSARANMLDRKHVPLGESRRARYCKDDMMNQNDGGCPTRRTEMEPPVCEKHIVGWWAYDRPGPALSVVPTRLASARNGREIRHVPLR